MKGNWGRQWAFECLMLSVWSVAKENAFSLSISFPTFFFFLFQPIQQKKIHKIFTSVLSFRTGNLSQIDLRMKLIIFSCIFAFCKYLGDFSDQSVFNQRNSLSLWINTDRLQLFLIKMSYRNQVSVKLWPNHAIFESLIFVLQHFWCSLRIRPVSETIFGLLFWFV